MKQDIIEKRKSAGHPIFVIIMFLALTGVVFYLPNLYRRYNKDLGEFLGVGEKDPIKSENKDDNIKPQSDYYQIGSNGELSYNEIKLNDISLNSDILSFTLNVENTIDLDECDYYIEFYENKNKFIGRRILNGLVTKSKRFNLNVKDLGITTSTYFTVSHIQENVIKPETLETNDEGIGSILCTLDNMEYNYEFNKGKLSKVKYKFTYNDTDMIRYSDRLLTYQKLVKENNDLTGVTSNVVENTNSFIYIVEYDYKDVKKFHSVKDKNIFRKDEPNNVINFKMNAEGFSCK